MHRNTTISWICLWSVALGFIGTPLQAQSQNLQNTIYQWQQESEQRYKRLKAELEDAQEANNALLRRMEALERENRKLRSSTDRIPSNPVSEDDLKRLSDQLIERIKTVDKKRADENKLLVEQIRQLVKAIEKLGKAPAQVTTPPRKPARRVKTSAELEVQPGYTLSAIAAAYKEDGYDVTVNDIMEANPQITDPGKVRAGDVIIIPIEWE